RSPQCSANPTRCCGKSTTQKGYHTTRQWAEGTRRRPGAPVARRKQRNLLQSELS
ncbi:hypothetical protein CEXT_411481, partial [Caerostris extrusa]